MRTCTDPISTDSLPSNTVGASTTRPSFPIKPGKLLINGEWRNSANSKTFDVIDPTTETVVAQIAEGTKEDAESAIAAAHNAFEDGAWGQISGHERGEILWRVGDLFHKYGEELAFLQAKEMGRLFTDSIFRNKTTEISLKFMKKLYR